MIDWHNLTASQVAFLSIFATLLVAVMSAVSAYVATVAKARADEKSTIRKEYREHLRLEYLPFLKYAVGRPRVVSRLTATALGLADIHNANKQFEEEASEWFRTALPLDASLIGLMGTDSAFNIAVQKFTTAEGDMSDVLREWSQTRKLTPQTAVSLERLLKTYMESSTAIRGALEAIIYPPKSR